MENTRNTNEQDPHQSLQNAEEGPSYIDLVNGYKEMASKPSQDAYFAHQVHKKEQAIILASGAAPVILDARKNIEAKNKVGKEAAEDPSIVALVAQDVSLQRRALAGDTSAGFSLSRNSSTSAPSSNPESPVGGRQAYNDAIGKLRVNSTITAAPTSPANNDKGTIEFTVEDTSDHTIIKQGDPQTPSSPVSAPTASIDTEPTSPANEPTFVDINLTQMEHDAVAQSPILRGDPIIEVVTPEKEEVYVNNFTPDEQAAAKEKWLRQNQAEAAIEDAEKEARVRAREQLAELTRASQERIENLNATLEARKEKSKGVLERMGLKVSKGLEAYNKLPKRTRTLIGVLFAGASVASGMYLGGAVATLAVAGSRALSATSFASRFYEKGVAEAEKEAQASGATLEKGKIALKSLGWGLLAALGAGAVFSTVGTAIGEAAGAIEQKVSPMIDSLKEFFNHADKIPDAVPTPDVVPTPEVFTSSFAEYTIKPGDNLTNIIKSELLAKLPEASGLTSFQQENIIQNLLASAKEHAGDAAYDMINKFANPDLIHPGEMLDLNKVKEAISSIHVDKFGGQTLLEHALTVKS